VLAAALADLSTERRDEVIAALEELQRALEAPGVGTGVPGTSRSGRPQVRPSSGVGTPAEPPPTG
jgi:hypothetical protein